MTTTTFSAQARNNDDATFRAWGSAVSTALAAIGFVKTSDTGQINWTTVLVPAANTFQGYEIWRFNDTLQATYPLFFKLEYGAGASSSTFPGLRLTIGKGSDGAGGITGILLNAQAIAAGSSGGVVGPWYMSSGDGSMLCFAPQPAAFNGVAANSWWNFMIERSRANDGTATGTGLLVAWQASASTPISRAYNYAWGTVVSDRWLAAVPGGATALASAGKVPFFPALFTDGRGNWWQPRCVLVGLKNDIGDLVPSAVQGFNTYLPITGMTYYDAALNPNVRAAIAWW